MSEPEEEVEAEEVVKFEFDEDFQTRVAALSVTDLAFNRRTYGLFSPENFDDVATAGLVKLSQDYYEKYRTVPGSISVWKEVFKDAIKSRSVDSDFSDEIKDVLRKVWKMSVPDREFIVEKVGMFAKKQAIERATAEAFELVQDGEIERASEILDKAVKTGAAGDIDIVDYWDSASSRTDKREELASGVKGPDGVTTGFPKIDALLYHKGWGRQELSVLMGGAKAGKSMGLGEFGIRASMMGMNVLYVTLEVSSDIIGDRMDANVSGTPMKELTIMRDDVYDKVDKRSASRRGKMIIATAPANSFRPTDFRRLLEYHRSQGYRFDLICVDYLDIMAPDKWTQSPIENSRTIWTDVREIAKEENAALLSATQTNRTGFSKMTARAEDVAEDFNKIRIADLVISINRTDDERKAGEARLFWAASRNQEGEFTVKIKQDLSQMRFVKSIEEIYEGEKK